MSFVPEETKQNGATVSNKVMPTEVCTLEEPDDTVR